MNETRRLQLNDKRLLDDNVDARLQTLGKRLLAKLEASGRRPLITCGFRSAKEQNALYALGRTKRGKIVTYAKGGQSKHNFGKALDFAFVDDNGKIDWSLKNFRMLGIYANELGLRWGGNFKRFKDYCHVEL